MYQLVINPDEYTKQESQNVRSWRMIIVPFELHSFSTRDIYKPYFGIERWRFTD